MTFVSDIGRYPYLTLNSGTTFLALSLEGTLHIVHWTKLSDMSLL